ncbi:phi13 family phage major tail protein [Ureibacillus xyleni]|uniref:Phi13 family phage major tail protein n=1 Tax=Ureibacillus xyleni TaxID=614648 RepID=A0A285SW07_9BACL|nr:major tail protein [Ureibacillus xyleni]SOC12807.1 phi13 family phage major tail protein [Ureibacillus xyleni]
MSNKIKYGLKNVHYAVITETAGNITYDTPKPLAGGVSISIAPNGELTEFHADDITYWSAEINNGYDGELEIADLPESFLVDVLGEELSNGVLYESSEAKSKKFALTFEINGDVKARRAVLYYCTATRPTIASQTKSATVEPQTSQLTFNARPRPTDYMIKAQTSVEVDATVYDAWNTTIHEKTVAGA